MEPLAEKKKVRRNNDFKANLHGFQPHLAAMLLFCIRYLGFFFLFTNILLLISIVKVVKSLLSGDCSETHLWVRKFSFLTQNKGLCQQITFTQETVVGRKAKKKTMAQERDSQ